MCGCFTSEHHGLYEEKCDSFIKMLLQSTVGLLLLLDFGATIFTIEEPCPTPCNCGLKHLSETAIYGFMVQKPSGDHTSKEADSVENNEVLNEDNIDGLIDESPIVRTVTCLVENSSNVANLVENLPKNIDVLTLVQGYASGNKTIHTKLFAQFNLISLEIIGMNKLKANELDQLLLEIDEPLASLKYLNLERVYIKSSQEQVQNFVRKINEDDLTFEYIQQGEGPALTMVKRGNFEEIVPYNKFKQRENLDGFPMFVGFSSLRLLRINNCNLRNVYWEMFDGLNNLEFLLLERNSLRFIPPFAFYGTPNLKRISLAHNDLLDIQLTDLAGLLKLETLDLGYNNFSQLSELSFPPFPELKLANFGNNPIGIIYPNTFEVMNTTDSLIIGSDDISLTLLKNSFVGLNLLKKLTINNVNQNYLTRDLFVGMPNLIELTITGNITKIEYDAFVEVKSLKRLILSNCNLNYLSMDAFMGLEQLIYLDLSFNNLSVLPAGLFDSLPQIKEIYLNNNQLEELPKEIFSHIPAKLIRLNNNPWHCSCQMSEWKPVIINRIKQRVYKPCEFTEDKRIGCSSSSDNRFIFKYVYDNKVSPKCAQPKTIENWSVFHGMRRIFKCKDYKPKFKKHLKTFHENISVNDQQNEIHPLVVNEIIPDNPRKRLFLKKLHLLKMKKL